MAWFRRRRQEPFDPLDERIERRVELEHAIDDRPTAAEAVALALPIARDIDPAATLRMVVGTEITDDGRSHTWDVLCDGRRRLAAVNVQLVVGIDLEDHVDHAQLVAIPKLPHDPDSFMRPLWERLDAGGRQVYLDSWFARTALPEDLDSAAAMASFTEEGFDLVSGPTDVVLSARHTDDGPVWTLTVGRDEATRRLT